MSSRSLSILPAVLAAVQRVHPQLSLAEAQCEAAWQITHIPVSPKGRIGWGVSKLGRDLRGCLSEAQNHRCCYCMERMDGATPGLRPTLEHVVALADGGIDHPDNLAVACATCNVGRDSNHRGRGAPALKYSVLSKERPPLPPWARF